MDKMEEIKKLSEFHDNLEKIHMSAEQEAEDERKELKILWKYLEEPSEKCQEFLDRHRGCSSNTLKVKLLEIEEELKHLLQDFESKNGKAFTLDGEPLAEELKRSAAEYITAKRPRIKLE